MHEATTKIHRFNHIKDCPSYCRMTVSISEYLQPGKSGQSIQNLNTHAVAYHKKEEKKKRTVEKTGSILVIPMRHDSDHEKEYLVMVLLSFQNSP